MSEPRDKKMTDNTLKARLERCKALQEPEQVVEVREGFVVCATVSEPEFEMVPLSEALTLRTAEDVRREALEEAVTIMKDFILRTASRDRAEDAILALIDNPAPKQDTRALQAAAWDEGRASRGNPAPSSNPYRKGDE